MVKDDITDYQDLSFPEGTYDLLKVHERIIPYGNRKNEPAGFPLISVLRLCTKCFRKLEPGKSSFLTVR
jgi:hypothetical protein